MQDWAVLLGCEIKSSNFPTTPCGRHVLSYWECSGHFIKQLRPPSICTSLTMNRGRKPSPTHHITSCVLLVAPSSVCLSQLETRKTHTSRNRPSEILPVLAAIGKVDAISVPGDKELDLPIALQECLLNIMLLSLLVAPPPSMSSLNIPTLSLEASRVVYFSMHFRSPVFLGCFGIHLPRLKKQKAARV